MKIKNVTQKEVFEALGLTNRQDGSILTLNKGIFTYRMGYYWRPKISPEDTAEKIKALLLEKGYNATIIDSGDHWAAFRGGENTKRNSHYWVKMRVDKVQG